MNIAIIQSRMGSQRLPGKMTCKIGNYRLIDWVIRRLKKSKSIHKIILATSNKKKKDIVFKSISKRLKIDFLLAKNWMCLEDLLTQFKILKKEI